MHRLNPIPLPSDLVVKKGINIFSCNSGGIPGPLSAMSIDMCSSCSAWMLILPFSFPSCHALLSTRLKQSQRLFPVHPYPRTLMEECEVLEGHSKHNLLHHPLLQLVFCFIHLVIKILGKSLKLLHPHCEVLIFSGIVNHCIKKFFRGHNTV